MATYWRTVIRDCSAAPAPSRRDHSTPGAIGAGRRRVRAGWTSPPYSTCAYLRTYAAVMSYRVLARHRTYRHLFAAQVVALLGTGLLTVALSLLAFDVAPGRAGAVVAGALTVKIVAYVAVAPLMSALVERVRPAVVMVGADLVRAAIAIALPFVSEVWQIYVLMFALQSASATFTPAMQAAIPAVLPREQDYTRALSLTRLAYDLESVVSPVIAAALLLVIDFQGLFAGTAAGFVASAVLVLSAGLRVEGRAAHEAGWAERTLAGVRMFAGRAPLRGLVLLDVVVAAATALVLVDTVVLVRADLGLGEGAVAWAFAAFGAGSMLVAFAAPAALERHGDRPVMITGAGVVALGLGAAAVSPPSFAGILALWAVLGAATSAVLTPSGRVVNRAVDPHERPAAFAAHFSLSHAAYLVTYPLAGWLGAAFSVATASAVLGMLAALALVAAAVVWPRASRGERQGVAGSPM